MAAAGPGWLSKISVENYRFSTNDVIDVGGFGCVVKASHIIRNAKTGKKRKKIRAIKFLNIHELCRRGQYASLDNAIRRVHREIEIHKQLRHDNIVRMYDNGYTSVTGSFDIIVYIVMKYISGTTLLSHVNSVNYQTSEVDVRDYFLQILSALEYMYKIGVSHRDLKLENIMLTKQNKLVLLDFGLSCQYGSNNISQSMCGSPIYAAPELWMGEPYHGATVDVWALGIILYALIFASFPYDDYYQTNQFALARYVVHHDIDIPDVMISKNLQRLLRDMLSRDVASRIPIDEIRKRTWISKDPSKWSFKHGLRLTSGSDGTSWIAKRDTSSPSHDMSPRDIWICKRRNDIRAPSPLSLSQKK